MIVSAKMIYERLKNEVEDENAGLLEYGVFISTICCNIEVRLETCEVGDIGERPWTPSSKELRCLK
jgi:hypothetical protein